VTRHLAASIDVRYWQIVLQKSFCFTDPSFSGLYARRSNVNVGDHFIL
jgi:hypothetical protein